MHTPLLKLVFLMSAMAWPLFAFQAYDGGTVSFNSVHVQRAELNVRFDSSSAAPTMKVALMIPTRVESLAVDDATLREAILNEDANNDCPFESFEGTIQRYGRGFYEDRWDPWLANLASCGPCLSSGMANCASQLVHLVSWPTLEETDVTEVLLSPLESTGMDQQASTYARRLVNWVRKLGGKALVGEALDGETLDGEAVDGETVDGETWALDTMSRVPSWIAAAANRWLDRCHWQSALADCGKSLGFDQLLEPTKVEVQELVGIKAETISEARTVTIDAFVVDVALRLDEIGRSLQKISGQLLTVAAQVRQQRGQVQRSVTGPSYPENTDLF